MFKKALLLMSIVSSCWASDSSMDTLVNLLADKVKGVVDERLGYTVLGEHSLRGLIVDVESNNFFSFDHGGANQSIRFSTAPKINIGYDHEVSRLIVGGAVTLGASYASQYGSTTTAKTMIPISLGFRIGTELLSNLAIFLKFEVGLKDAVGLSTSSLTVAPSLEVEYCFPSGVVGKTKIAALVDSGKPEDSGSLLASFGAGYKLKI